MKTILSMSLLLLLPFLSQAQFDSAAYHKVSQGADPENPGDQYTIIYKSNQDTSYRLKKIYTDSGYTNLQSKVFYKGSLADGPYVIYNKSKVVLQGMYKNGKWDGEKLTYLGEQVLQKAYYTDGVKTGTWEEYSPQGQLKRKITFDNNGKVVLDVKY